jgi:hypothetical protein
MENERTALLRWLIEYSGVGMLGCLDIGMLECLIGSERRGLYGSLGLGFWFWFGLRLGFRFSFRFNGRFGFRGKLRFNSGFTRFRARLSELGYPTSLAFVLVFFWALG